MPLWQKLSYALVLSAITLAAFCVVHKLVVRPVNLFWRESREVRQTREKLAAVNKENEALRARKGSPNP